MDLHIINQLGVSFARLYPIKAHWELCADNLLDLSHTPFIHTKTVGVREMELRCSWVAIWCEWFYFVWG